MSPNPFDASSATVSVGAWRGWAHAAAKEKIKFRPSFTNPAVHPECADPEHSWNCLISLYNEMFQMESGERLPSEVTGNPGAGWEEAGAFLERRLDWHASRLAWGDGDY